ncbi:MAG: EamA family transporter [Candidatus Nanopelagicales bacterium]
MTSPRAAIAMTVGAGALFATGGTAQALGPAGTTPFTVAEMRLGIGGLIMLLLLPLLGHHIRDVWRCLPHPLVWLLGVTSLAFQVLYFTGVSQAGVALGSLLAMGSVPVFAGLLGALFGHRISSAWAVATAICVGGLALLSLDGIQGGSAWGVLASLCGGLSGAIFVLITKVIIQRGIPPVPANVTAYLLAGLALVPVILLTPQNLSWIATTGGIILALYLGFFAMAIPNVLWVKGLGILAPGPSSTLMLTEPAVATLLGIVVLGETLAMAGVVGLVLVMTGLLLQGLSLARNRAEQPVIPR